MEYRNLPHGDEKISVLGLGMGGIDSEIEQTVCKAVDNGITFFDLCGGSQILLVTGGKGWYQAEGEPARALFPGDVVVIPADVKHWHGAAKDSWFSHLAVGSRARRPPMNGSRR